MPENKNENIVFIGNKPFMNYIKTIIIQFTIKNKKQITIKARGKLINKAVSLAEAIRKKFLKDKNISVKNIKINSEEVENKDKKKINISTIEITLIKNK